MMSSIFLPVLALSMLRASVYGFITSQVLNMARAGQWVALQGAVNKAMVQMVQVGNVPGAYPHIITISEAENFCVHQGSHLVSVHSDDEKNFLAGHYNHRINTQTSNIHF
ncbi:hypothetical protein COOONC_04851 [Cooperia oncophora]